MAREPRFPGIDWYCDHCGALLNTQKGFDDHKYTWKCKECGYKNSISSDNIGVGDSKALRYLRDLLSFLSFVGYETSLMLGIAMLVFKADKCIYFVPFLAFLGMFIFAWVLLILVHFGLRHAVFNGKNVFRLILDDIWIYFIGPFMSLKLLLGDLVSLIFHIIPFVRKKKLYINKMSFIYGIITFLEIVAFSRIIGFGLSDWISMFNSGITWLKQLIP